MEVLEKFIILPAEEIYRGIRVNEKTDKHFEVKRLEPYVQEIVQDVKGTKLISKVITQKNNYKTTSEAEIQLNAGDILLFSEDYGYYPPQEKVGSVDDGMQTLLAQKDLIEKSYKEKE